MLYFIHVCTDNLNLITFDSSIDTGPKRKDVIHCFFIQSSKVEFKSKLHKHFKVYIATIKLLQLLRCTVFDRYVEEEHNLCQRMKSSRGLRQVLTWLKAMSILT